MLRFSKLVSLSSNRFTALSASSFLDLASAATAIAAVNSVEVLEATFCWAVKVSVNAWILAFLSASVFLASFKLLSALASAAFFVAKSLWVLSRSKMISLAPVPSSAAWALVTAILALSSCSLVCLALASASLKVLEVSSTALAWSFSSFSACSSLAFLSTSAFCASSSLLLALASASFFVTKSVWALSRSEMISLAPLPSRFFWAVSTSALAFATLVSWVVIFVWSLLTISVCLLTLSWPLAVSAWAFWNWTSWFSIADSVSLILCLVLSISTGVALSLIIWASSIVSLAVASFFSAISSSVMAFLTTSCWAFTDCTATLCLFSASLRAWTVTLELEASNSVFGFSCWLAFATDVNPVAAIIVETLANTFIASFFSINAKTPLIFNKLYNSYIVMFTLYNLKTTL